MNKIDTNQGIRKFALLKLIKILVGSGGGLFVLDNSSNSPWITHISCNCLGWRHPVYWVGSLPCHEKDEIS